MHKPGKLTALLLCTVFTAGLLTACNTPSVDIPTNTVATPDPTRSDITEPVMHGTTQIDTANATQITLNDTDAQITGNGTEISNGVITITDGGTYTVTGTLTDGRILVNAKGENISLIFDNTDIACSYGSPLYIYQAACVTLHLTENTENTLSDGTAYTFADTFSSSAENEPNACLYSKSDLIIQGSGILTVNARYNNGITSKDILEIHDAQINVTAANHGINGKDSNTISNAYINIISNGDALRSSNDTDNTLGWISISDSTLDLTTKEDGIQAETWAKITNCDCNITSGNGSDTTPGEDVSSKGIKAGTDLTITGGQYNLNCSDDAIHANGDVTIADGDFNIATDDDAVHADNLLTVSDGQINITQSYEGLEGSDITISGGDIHIISSDDGVNAAGGADGSGFMGRGMDDNFMRKPDDTAKPTINTASITQELIPTAKTAHAVTITGGNLTIYAGGDGLDSNGSLTITGGTIQVSSVSMGNGALDYDGSCTLSGGVLLAVCSGGMAQAPNSPEQNTISVQFDTTLPAGTYIQLTSAEHEFVFLLPDEINHMVFSSPDLISDETYTLSYGGTYSDTNQTGMLCTGGTYTGGTQFTELTLTTGLTTYGQIGMGGSKSGNMFGKDGQHGMFRNNPDDPGSGKTRPQMPDNTWDGATPPDDKPGNPPFDEAAEPSY